MTRAATIAQTWQRAHPEITLQITRDPAVTSASAVASPGVDAVLVRSPADANAVRWSVITARPPTGAVRAFADWARSPDVTSALERIP